MAKRILIPFLLEAGLREPGAEFFAADSLDGVPG